MEAQPAFVEYFVSLMRVRSSIAAEYNPALLAVGLQPVEVCLAGKEIPAPVRIEFSTQLCTRNMIGKISTLVVAAMLVLALAAPAFAASPSERQCDTAGRTFTKSGGQVQCVIVEEGKNSKFTDTETTTGQGNISNKQQQSNECGGTGSGKCPPGQF